MVDPLEYTSHKGASFEIMLGDTPGALYPLEVTCVGENETTCTAGNTGKPGVVFTHHAYDCGPNPVSLRVYYQADNFGRPLNAAQVGGNPVPLVAQLIATTNTGATTDFASAQVTFDDVPGTEQGPGLFKFDYSPETIGLDRVKVTGSATTRDGASGNGGPFWLPVYGVDLVLNTPPPIVLDDSFRAQADYPIEYTILPPEYRAGDAYIELDRNDNPIAFLISEPQGQGSGTIARGFEFNAFSSTYTAQVLLNLGGGLSEMRSEKVLLTFGVPIAVAIADAQHGSGGEGVVTGPDMSTIDLSTFSITVEECNLDVCRDIPVSGYRKIDATGPEILLQDCDAGGCTAIVSGFHYKQTLPKDENGTMKANIYILPFGPNNNVLGVPMEDSVSYTITMESIGKMVRDLVANKWDMDESTDSIFETRGQVRFQVTSTGETLVLEEKYCMRDDQVPGCP